MSSEAVRLGHVSLQKSDQVHSCYFINATKFWLCEVEAQTILHNHASLYHAGQRPP